MPFILHGGNNMNKAKQFNIRQRKDGSYEARITVAGKRYSKYGKSVAEVKRKVKQLQDEFEKENVIAENIRLNVALESYLEDVKRCKVKSTTYDRVESTFKHHIQYEALGRMQVGTITDKDVQKLLIEKCEQGMSASSIKKIYNLLGEFFRYATATKVIGSNPMVLVEMPHSSIIQYQEKEMEVLTSDEMKRIIAVAEQVDKNGQPIYKYGEAIIFLLLTGMRSGELRGLNVSDIDLEKRKLRVRHNATYSKDRKNGGIIHSVGDVKTKKSKRNIPLNDRAVLAIDRMLKTTCNHDTGYLVCTTTGQIVTHSNLQRCYSLILKKAGVKHMGLHSTRHSFATVVLKDAEDKGQIKEVSEMLGHSKISTTYQYYIKASDTEKRNLVNQLNELVC